MFKEIIDKIDELEERMVDYAEANSFLFNHNRIYMISTNKAYETPEYNFQPYTFKYGDYSISDYLKQYRNA